MVLVFTHQGTFNALSSGRFVDSDGRYIDEKPRLSIDPPRIDHVELVFGISVDVRRVDLEHIVSTFGNMWQMVMVHRQVVVGCEKMHCV